MKITHLLDWKRRSFRRRIAEFYQRLDSITLPTDCDAQVRSDFFRKSRGEFISILKIKKGLSDNQVASFLKISSESLSGIEKGQIEIADLDFFNLCIYLGSAHEISVFIEKMGNAMRPGLREARNTAKETLKLYGIRLNNDDQDDHQ